MYKCFLSDCDRNLNSIRKLIEHMKFHESSDGNIFPLKCNICNNKTKFFEFRKIQRHLKTNHNMQNNVSSFCNSIDHNFIENNSADVLSHSNDEISDSNNIIPDSNDIILYSNQLKKGMVNFAFI